MIILLSFILSISAFAEPECELGLNSLRRFMDMDSTTAKALIKFHELDGVTKKNGLSAVTGKKTNVFFTADFKKRFEKIDKESNFFNNFKDKKMRSYSYYKSQKLSSYDTLEIQKTFENIRFSGNRRSLESRIKRGSGRDHLIANSNIGVKGSGINKKYSSVNSSFKLEDFRSNGLLLLNESLVEFSIAQILDSLNFSINKHLDFVILPKKIQDTIYSISKKKTWRPDEFNKKKEFNFYAVQVHRELDSLRESNALLELNPAEYQEYLQEYAIPLASKMLVHNFGHGAINHENLSFGAKILDLGHTTVGSPVLNNSHRCTMRECAGMEGSDSDGTMVGVFDHYFGKSFIGELRDSFWGGESSYSGINKKLKKFYPQLIQSIFSDLGINKLNSKFDKTLNNAMSAMLKNKLTIQNNSKNLSKISKFSSGIFGVKSIVKENYPLELLYQDSKLSYSVKFLLQIAHLKNSLPKAKYNKVLKKVLGLVGTKKNREYTKSLINYFSKNLKNIDQKSSKSLMAHHLPTSFMERKIDNTFKKGDSYSEITKKSASLLKNLKKPQNTKVEKFSDLIIEHF